MTNEDRDDLLAALSGKAETGEQNASWAQVDATLPAHESPGVAADTGAPVDEDLQGLLHRIKQLTGDSPDAIGDDGGSDPDEGSARSFSGQIRPTMSDGFVPIEPESFVAAGLTESEVEALVLKYLLARGDASGHDIADQVRLPFRLIEELLAQLKSERLVGYKAAAPMNDYVYQISDWGQERARRFSQQCSYLGAAPVSLGDYIDSVRVQSLEQQRPTNEDLRRAFHDLFINKQLLRRLGPAINSGRGLFLYGSSGNGKTSIAERITAAFGMYVWIPRAIGVDGEIIRVFDPNHHVEGPEERPDGIVDARHIDRRWIRVRRPTIVAGGELNMDNLEVRFNTATGVSEAPLQLKANCGTLLIDDFGRHRMGLEELLNRWIVPLEKRYDFLNLSNGRKIQVPFDELIVFATNLQPKKLVDEAFLRRIPYKIEVVDPSEAEFHELFKLMCPRLGFEYCQETVEYALDKHFRRARRPLRYCHPRDLLLQIRNFCHYQNRKLELTCEYIDFAVENYFAVM